MPGHQRIQIDHMHGYAGVHLEQHVAQLGVVVHHPQWRLWMRDEGPVRIEQIGVALQLIDRVCSGCKPIGWRSFQRP